MSLSAPTAVVDVLQDLERLGDDVVPLLALDVGHEAQAAGVVLVCGGIQAVLGQVLDFCIRGHRRTPSGFHSIAGEAEHSALQQGCQAE